MLKFKMLSMIIFCILYSCDRSLIGNTNKYQSPWLKSGVVPGATSGADEIDTDGDGISDDREIAEGTDPESADIPVVSIESIRLLEFSAEQAMENEHVGLVGWRTGISPDIKMINHSKEYLKEKLARFAMEIKVNNSSAPIVTPTIEDAFDPYLATPGKLFAGVDMLRPLVEYSGRVKALVSLSFKNVSETAKITGLRFKAFVKSESGASITVLGIGIVKSASARQDLFSRNVNESSTEEIQVIFDGLDAEKSRELLSGRGKLGLVVDDFTMEGPPYNGLTFRKLLKNVQEKCAHLVIKNEEDVKFYFLAGRPMAKEILEKLFWKVDADLDAGVAGLNESQNNLSFPIDWNEARRNEYSGGFWSSFPKIDLDKTILEAGKTYVLAWNTAADLLPFHTQTYKDAISIKDSSAYKFSPLMEGDEIVVRISGIRRRPVLREWKQEVELICRHLEIQRGTYNSVGVASFAEIKNYEDENIKFDDGLASKRIVIDFQGRPLSTEDFQKKVTTRVMGEGLELRWRCDNHSCNKDLKISVLPDPNKKEIKTGLVRVDTGNNYNNCQIQGVGFSSSMAIYEVTETYALEVTVTGRPR